LLSDVLVLIIIIIIVLVMRCLLALPLLLLLLHPPLSDAIQLNRNSRFVEYASSACSSIERSAVVV